MQTVTHYEKNLFNGKFQHVQENGTINFTIVSYGLRGNLIEMRQLKLTDLNLCNRVSASTNSWQQNFKFSRNYLSTCTINLQEFIDLQPDTKFSSIYLNYFEKQSNFLQTVPILIRKAFKVNEVRTSIFYSQSKSNISYEKYLFSKKTLKTGS